MTSRPVPARLAVAVAVSLSLAFLLTPSATAAPVAEGVHPSGPVVDRAWTTTGPSIPDPLRLVAAGDAATLHLAAAGDAEPSDVERAAEVRALALVADARTAAGAPALRADPGLAAIARRRAADMRDHGYFGHTAPDGHTVFDMLDAAAVAWASGAEVIGWNNVSTADGSAARVVADWLASPSHRVDLLSPDSDRIGLASVFDPATGRRIWAGLLVASADRNAPVASVRVAVIGPREPSGFRAVTVAWESRDDPGTGIATGVRDVTVQVRVGAAPWRTTLQGAAGSHVHLRLPAGRVVAIRVRPRDRAGNLGAWASVTIRP